MKDSGKYRVTHHLGRGPDSEDAEGRIRPGSLAAGRHPDRLYHRPTARDSRSSA